MDQLGIEECHIPRSSKLQYTNGIVHYLAAFKVEAQLAKLVKCGVNPFKLLLIQYPQNPLGNCHNGTIGVSPRSKGIRILGEDDFVRKPVAAPIHDQGKNKGYGLLSTWVMLSNSFIAKRP